MRRRSFLKFAAIVTTALVLLVITLVGCDLSSDSACRHEALIHHDAVEPQCFEYGNIEYWTCEKCGKYFSDASAENEITYSDTVLEPRHYVPDWEIDYTGHKGKCSICDTILDGEHEYNDNGICRICGYDSNHKHELVFMPAKAATCAEYGNVDCWQCSVCGMFFRDAQGEQPMDKSEALIERPPHNLIIHQYVAGTCISEGSIYYVECTVCGKYFLDNECVNEISAEDTVIPVSDNSHGPIYQNPYKAPTCTEEGNLSYDQCSYCGKYFLDYTTGIEVSFEEIVIPPTGHSMTHHPYCASTCTAEGNVDFYYCEACGKYYSDVEGNNELSEQDIDIPMIAHDAVYREYKPSTCTEEGNIAHWECVECGKLFSDKKCTTELSGQDIVVGCIAHKPELRSGKAATCLDDGNISYWECTCCGGLFADENCEEQISYEDTVIPAEGHIAGDKYEYDGIAHWLVCTTCKEVIDREEHTFENGVCTVCGFNETTFTEGLAYTEVISESMQLPIGYTVTGIGDATDEYVVIPDTYKDLPVLGIADRAFENNDNIRSVYIPDIVISIGQYVFSGCDELTSVRFSANVFEISDGMFKNCSSLTSVTLPEGTVSIGTSAFENCYSLKSIYIPDSLTEIDYTAFAYCRSLEEVCINDLNVWLSIDFASASANPLGYAKYLCVDGEPLTDLVIPDGVSAIKRYAFANYDSLESVSMPLSLTEIGEYAFYGCDSLKGEIVVSSGVSKIMSYAFSGCGNITYVSFGDGSAIDTISNRAFYGCERLCGIELPEILKNIESYAFGDCRMLTEITVPRTVTHIGEYAFDGCVELREITLPFVGTGGTSGTNRLFGIIFADSQSVGYEAVDQNGKTTYIPQTLTKVTINGGEIYPDAFYGCTMIRNVVLNQDVTGIGDNAFNNCTSLGSVTIEDGATGGIGNYAFINCKELEFFDNSSTMSGNIGDYAFYECVKLVGFDIPEGVTEIGECAFASCIDLENVKLPDSLETIGKMAFDYCMEFTTINIPINTKSIGDNAFDGCYNVETVYFNATDMPDLEVGNCAFFELGAGNGYSVIFGEGIQTIPANLFNHSYSLVNVELNEGIVSIGSGAFSYCEDIKEIYIPSGVTYIGENAFVRCSDLDSITVAPENTAYKDVDGVLYSRNGSLLVYPARKSGSSYEIEEGTERIGAHAFAENSFIEKIVIPDSVTYIGEYAFYYCDSLSSINLPENLLKLNENVFNNCFALESIVIPANVQEIAAGAFLNCKNLKSIFMPSALKTVGASAFFSCDQLKSVYIENLSGWAKTTFQNSSANPLSCGADLYLNGELVTDLVLEGVDQIRNYAFYNCTSIKSVTLSEEVTSIGHRAFFGCTSLEKIVISENVTDISSYVFEDCPVLNEIVYNAKNLESSPLAFSPFIGSGYEGEGITVTFGEKVQKIPDNFLKEYDGKSVNVKDIVFEGNTTEIGQYAFLGCPIENVVLPESVKIIRIGAFVDCTALESVTINGSLSVLEAGVFIGCNNIREIYISGIDNEAQISTDAFSNLNSNDISLTFGQGVEKIPENMFANLSVTSINFGGVKTIGRDAFAYCDKLVELVLPASIESISDGAFKNCSALESVTISAGIDYIGENAFDSCENLTIYCEDAEKPAGWSNDWAGTGPTVVWDCKNNQTAAEG